MEIWIYQGKQVEVCDKYSSHWVHREVGGDGTGKQGYPGHYTPVNAPIQRTEVTQAETNRASTPAPAPVSNGLPSNPSQFEINSATLSEIKRTFKGKVGATDSSKVFQRKPEGGYKSWEELIELNSDLGVNWEEVKLDLPIEVKF